MPIYAYKCDACGFAQDVLRKVSDAPLTVCPVCGADAFRKQLTAAGFQLKGSGWYVTDFKGGAKATASGDKGGDKAGEGDKAAGEAKPADKAGESKPAEKSGSETKAASPPPPPPAPSKPDT